MCLGFVWLLGGGRRTSDISFQLTEELYFMSTEVLN